MFNLEPFLHKGILRHTIIEKDGNKYPVWVCSANATEKDKQELQRITDEYKKCYGIPLIGFEK